MAEAKDELPIVGYFWLDKDEDTWLHLADKAEDAALFSPHAVTALTPHAAAQSRINALLEGVEGLRKDAERLEFILSCDFLAARTYLPDLNANDFIAKRRASLDEQIARRASLSSGRSGSGEASNG